MSFPVFIILDNHHPIPSGQVSPEAQPALLRSLLAAAKMNRLIIDVLLPELQLCPLIRSWPPWLLGCDFDAHKPLLSCRVLQGESTSGCQGTDQPTLEEKMKIKYYFRSLSLCVVFVRTLSMFVCKTDSAWHIWVCKSSLGISSKHFFLFLRQEKIIRCTQLLFASWLKTSSSFISLTSHAASE